MKADLDSVARKAIAELRAIRLTYDGEARVVEPHDYGVKDGVEKIFCWQLEGASGEGWRNFIVANISAPSITRRRFPGPRPATGKHLDWDELYASVSRKPFKRLR
jgi:hypothetical protein